LKKNEVKKHVAAIHIKNTLSCLQRKIANVLLVNAYEDLLAKEVHAIRTRELAQAAGYDSHDHQILKNALITLAETTLEWNILNDGEEEWGVSVMLAQAKIRRGICYYAYSPDLRQKFYNPEIYARINLAIQRKFSSSAALALYENCVRYAGVGSTGWWPLGEVRSLLGVGEYEYREFKDLNKWVIKPSIKQVNKNSDILLEVDYCREKRRIVALKFKVQKNTEFLVYAPVAKEAVSKPQESSEKDKPHRLAEFPAAVVSRLQEFGFSKARALAVVQQHGEAYVTENLDVVERDCQAGKVKDLPRYTAAGLRDDYRPRQSPHEAAQIRRKQAVKTHASQIQQEQMHLEALKKEFERYQLEQALNGLSKQATEALRQYFLKKYENNRFFQRWIKQGFEHRVVQSLFRAFAAAELLKKPGEGEFETFVKNRGENLASLKRNDRGCLPI
jgi:hypothetical protein